MLAATLRGLVDDSLVVTLRTDRMMLTARVRVCIRNLIVLENREQNIVKWKTMP
jgi:hypothetical protein